jgi:hypothetical protein
MGAARHGIATAISKRLTDTYGPDIVASATELADAIAELLGEINLTPLLARQVSENLTAGLRARGSDDRG